MPPSTCSFYIYDYCFYHLILPPTSPTSCPHPRKWAPKTPTSNLSPQERPGPSDAVPGVFSGRVWTRVCVSRSTRSDESRSGSRRSVTMARGFHGGIQNGWFISWKIRLKNGWWFGGSPITQETVRSNTWLEGERGGYGYFVKSFSAASATKALRNSQLKGVDACLQALVHNIPPGSPQEWKSFPPGIQEIQRRDRDMLGQWATVTAKSSGICCVTSWKTHQNFAISEVMLRLFGRPAGGGSSTCFWWLWVVDVWDDRAALLRQVSSSIWATRKQMLGWTQIFPIQTSWVLSLLTSSLPFSFFLSGGKFVSFLLGKAVKPRVWAQPGWFFVEEMNGFVELKPVGFGMFLVLSSFEAFWNQFPIEDGDVLPNQVPSQADSTLFGTLGKVPTSSLHTYSTPQKNRCRNLRNPAKRVFLVYIFYFLSSAFVVLQVPKPNMPK